jgi:hypothetical protein
VWLTPADTNAQAAKDRGRRRFSWVSGAQSGSAVRSVGGPLETAPTAPVKYYMFGSALA